MPDPHPLVRLAAQAIEAYLDGQRIIEPPESLFAEMAEALKPAGVFVCLKRQERLRGCIGTTEPVHETLAVEVIRNAIGAATRDPRFPALEPYELEELSITIDVLGLMETVGGPGDLDHKRYGIILSAGDRRSVLLPDIEGVDSVSEQLAVARQKAGVGPDDPVELLRFEITRYR
jgi:AmmeMemoRadiSam system protein A